MAVRQRLALQLALVAAATAVVVDHTRGGGLRSHTTSADVASAEAAFAASSARAMGRVRAAVTPEDIQSCMIVASRFIHGPKAPSTAVELAVDYCATHTTAEDRGRVCPHFLEAVVRSLEGLPEDMRITAESFCQIAEARMIEIRGATKVPRVGTGPMTNFRISETCAPMVREVMGSQHTIPAAKAGEFWYLTCLNQDCAHFLPSRTKWCDIDQAPTHTAWVCDSARHYVEKHVAEKGADVNSSDMCNLYADFVKDSGIDVEAFEHVMHADTSNRIPQLDDEASKALRSSQLVNDAGSHELRDSMDDPVFPGANPAPITPAPPAWSPDNRHKNAASLGAGPLLLAAPLSFLAFLSV